MTSVLLLHTRSANTDHGQGLIWGRGPSRPPRSLMWLTGGLSHIRERKNRFTLTPRPSPRIVRGRGQNMEHEFLSYDEAAVRLEIKPDSVRRRARSRKWPRRTGNDGKALVGVPTSALPPDLSWDHPPGPPPGDPGDAVRIAALEVEVKMLREQVKDLRGDRDRLYGLLERTPEPRTGIIERIVRLVRS